MQCWINGTVCLNQRGNNPGLLNVSDTFCQGCYVLLDNLQNVGRILEEMGVTLENYQIIDEDDSLKIIECKDVIVKALDCLKKEQKEHPDDKGAEGFEVVPELRKIFEKLKSV